MVPLSNSILHLNLYDFLIFWPKFARERSQLIVFTVLPKAARDRSLAKTVAKSKSELFRLQVVLIPSFVLSRWDLSFAHTEGENSSELIMAFGAVNLAGIGLDSWRRGAPTPRGENFGGAMNGRTKTD